MLVAASARADASGPGKGDRAQCGVRDLMPSPRHPAVQRVVDVDETRVDLVLASRHHDSCRLSVYSILARRTPHVARVEPRFAAKALRAVATSKALSRRVGSQGASDKEGHK